MTKTWKLKNKDKRGTKQRLQRAEVEPGEGPAEAGASNVRRKTQTLRRVAAFFLKR